MRYHLIVFSVFLLLFTGNVHGQTAPSATDTAGAKLYTYIEQMPVFPVREPGDSARLSSQRLMKFLNDSLRFPPQALRDRIQGKIFFSFAVNAQGRTADIKLTKGLRADVDAEILRNAHRLDAIQWQPGTQNGQPVRVSFTVPINLSMENNPSNQRLRGGDSLAAPAYNKAVVLPLNSWGTDRRLMPSDKGIIYGSCIQRLGFSSGGLGQYVRLANLTTGKAIRLGVKPAMRSRKENTFCYALPPGRYALYKYEFAISKWYGADMYVEEFMKQPVAQLTSLRATRYLFTVEAGLISYVGTWNLEQENKPVFTNEKSRLDAQLIPNFKYLQLDKAVVALPE